MQRTMPVMLRKRPDVVVAGVTIDCALPGMVVFIRPTKVERKRFARFCHAMNIGWEDLGDGAYLCVGGFDNLTDLSGKWMIRSWHWCENKNLSKGSGAGQKVKPKRSNVFDKPDDADAQNEKLRRLERRVEEKAKAYNAKADRVSDAVMMDALED